MKSSVSLSSTSVTTLVSMLLLLLLVTLSSAKAQDSSLEGVPITTDAGGGGAAVPGKNVGAANSINDGDVDDKYCEDGVLRDIFNSHCCHSSCSKCGGFGCGKDGNKASLCCIGQISNSCLDSTAPCIMELDNEQTGICVFSTIKALQGNYQYDGIFNGKPLWKKPSDTSNGADFFVYSLEVSGGSFIWAIDFALGDIKTFGFTSQYNVDYPFNSDWIGFGGNDHAIVEGLCEDYI